jgi:hypothetical protein
MIEKIVSLILFSYVTLIIPYIFLNSGNMVELSYIVKRFIQELTTALFKYGINGNLYLAISDKPCACNDNKIDIIIANKTNIVNDIMLMLITLQHLDISTFNFYYDDSYIKYIPGINALLKASNDINLNTNKKQLANIITNINVDISTDKQFIIIFEDNYDKMFSLVNELHEQKKIGKIWQFYNNNNNNDNDNNKYYYYIKKLNIQNYTELKVFTKQIKKNLHIKNKVKYTQLYVKNNYYYFILIIIITCVQTILLGQLKHFLLFIFKILLHFFI